MELRDRLQSKLGNAYSVERELGGSGMSRVFLAHETALGRTVVVKVLSGDIVAGANALKWSGYLSRRTTPISSSAFTYSRTMSVGTGP